MDGRTNLVVDPDVHKEHSEEKATGYAEGSNYFHVVFETKQ